MKGVTVMSFLSLYMLDFAITPVTLKVALSGAQHGGLGFDNYQMLRHAVMHSRFCTATIVLWLAGSLAVTRAAVLLIFAACTSSPFLLCPSHHQWCHSSMAFPCESTSAFLPTPLVVMQMSIMSLLLQNAWGFVSSPL
jgi:hypothetical protein